MTAIQFTAKVKTSRILELPEEALDLKLKTDEQVTITLDRNTVGENPAGQPNEKMLAILKHIKENQIGRLSTDSTETQFLIREARSGAMYSDNPTD